MKNVFITGATSFIGINLIDQLLEKGYNITAIIRKNSKKKHLLFKYPRINIIELDIKNIDQLPSLIDYDCDVFYHLAWNGTRGADRDNLKLQKFNYDYSIQALKSAKRLNCKVFISAGSQAEYGLYNEMVTEETIAKPNTQYGIYKLKLCEFAINYCKKHNIRFLEPRFFSLYGPLDFNETLIMSSINKLLNNEELNLTKCIQTWNYLYIDEAINALIKLQESNNSGIYNFGSDDTRKLKEFIAEIYSITNSNSVINFGTIEYGRAGIINVNPSNKKLKRDIDWRPQISFQEGVKKIIEKNKEKCYEKNKRINSYI